MNIRTKRNPYLGVNAHANSWQLNTEGEWQSFHTGFIVKLTDHLNQTLPSGYEARIERFLRLKEAFPPAIDSPDKRHLSRQDMTVYQLENPSSALITNGSSANAPALVMSALDAMPNLENISASTAIYDVSTAQERAITHIELLLPSNKRPGREEDSYQTDGYNSYLQQRQRVLHHGLTMVEIDLIHDRPSILPQLSRYPETEKSQAYSITVISPYPSLAQGTAKVYQFAVDESFPRFDMPLGATNTLPAANYDLGIVYNIALAAIPTVARKVDYAQPPLRAETYSLDDRQRIAARMLMLHLMLDEGVDLDQIDLVPIDQGWLDAHANDYDLLGSDLDL